MPGDEHSRQGHLSRHLLERLDVDRHGGDPSLFGDPRDVSHGHVADRSDGDQEENVHRLPLQATDPLERGLLEETEL